MISRLGGGLGASTDLLLEIGVEAVERRVLALTDRLCEGLTDLDAEIVSTRDDHLLCVVIGARECDTHGSAGL